ncbi:hypothetical protein EXIGLDRAFT_294011 [Exidia glandulosa HHB12029]|uniref:Uncharacterized protein n=1 Tax=Exidia glandulosa HHB12029 TaxID=1314781 RepID=A0A165DDP4_EXIGL|nr:hypothetical protein EXIGLDRAFT_294011 [Exidia glandulosa HHB12029]
MEMRTIAQLWTTRQMHAWATGEGPRERGMVVRFCHRHWRCIGAGSGITSCRCLFQRLRAVASARLDA